MTRRAWLGLVSGLLASCADGRAEASGVLERVEGSPFPWPTFSVPGRNALRAWESLREAGDGWPLIVGNPNDVPNLAEGLANDPRDVSAILEAASQTSFPAELLTKRRGEIDEMMSEFAGEWDGDIVGEWPTEISPNPPASLANDILKGTPLPRVWIVVLPTRDPAEAIALLKYGGWNDCPPCEQHVAAVRHWGEAYGFEPVGVSFDVIEGRVKRRPPTREAAVSLAWEQYAYCGDIVDQGTTTISDLAGVLMESDWWFFWWD